MADPSDTMPVRVGEIIADKYRVDACLGVGGMGVVAAATNVALGKRVALKWLLPSALAAPTAIERFEREARAAVQLRCEHVAQVLDVGRLANGTPYLVMELLDGSDLAAWVQERGPLPVEDAVDFVIQACEAIAEAHVAGIVHRDLKPRNLFLTRKVDGSPLVKVLDFGISKWKKEGDDLSLTRTSDVIGSPNYMSPEQIRSAKDVDGRSDIWSLGVILYELLAGRVPFLADSVPQLCALVLGEPPAPLASLRKDLPAPLVAAVERCLEKKPSDRFQTVGELVAALEPIAPERSRSTIYNVRVLEKSAPGSTPSAPAAPSARVHVSNGTSVSWAETIFAGSSAKRAVSVVGVVGIAAAVGAFVLLGVRGVPRSPPLGPVLDADVLPVPSRATASATPPVEVSTPPVAEHHTMLPAADAGPVASGSRPERSRGPRPPLAPPPTASAAISAVPEAPKPAPPSEDALMPGDRK